ncbi:MAG: acyl-CoA dehydrogenase family protein, partial [Lysobacter sp.]
MSAFISTPEHLALRETVARFVAQEIDPNVEAWESAGQFPARELFKKLGNLGLLGITKPVEYGGSGLDH